jgi:hypothetical protein
LILKEAVQASEEMLGTPVSGGRKPAHIGILIGRQDVLRSMRVSYLTAVVKYKTDRRSIVFEDEDSHSWQPYHTEETLGAFYQTTRGLNPDKNCDRSHLRENPKLLCALIWYNFLSIAASFSRKAVPSMVSRIVGIAALLVRFSFVFVSWPLKTVHVCTELLSVPCVKERITLTY